MHDRMDNGIQYCRNPFGGRTCIRKKSPVRKERDPQGRIEKVSFADKRHFFVVGYQGLEPRINRL